MKSSSVIRSLVVVALVAVPLLPGTVIAQQAESFEGHPFLQKFAGKWNAQSKGSMGEGQPEMEGSAVMNARMLGELWVLCEIEGNVAGMSYGALQTFGYNAATKRFTGSWVDSLQTHMWVYDGWLDESGNKLTLEADGPNMLDPGKVSKYRDAYEFKGDDQIISTSSMLGDDGQWVTFMKGTATRVKD